MKTRALFLSGWCALTLPCEAAHAGETPASDAADRLAYADNIAPAATVAVIAADVDDYLRSAGAEAGVSFIFDSSLTKGRIVVPPSASPTASTIEKTLGFAGLTLHRVGATTYVVKELPAALLAAASPSSAGSSSPRLPDVILVTGAMIASAANLPSGVSSALDRQALDTLNETTVERVIFSLPQTLSSITSNNTALFGAVAGINFADLRGIGSQRTGVFVDGHEATLTYAGNGELAGYDLNAIPEPFLERIELETGPAAARRNPRAVAGAINFVLRKPRDGFEAGVRAGMSQQGDAEEVSVYGLGGVSFAQGAGGLTFGAALTTLQGLVGADRNVTATPYGYSPDGDFLPNFGNSYFSSAPVVSGVLLDNDQVAWLSLQDRLEISQAGGLDDDGDGISELYNWSSELNTILPQERGYAYASAEYAPTSRLTLAASVRAANVRTDINLAPLPTSLGRGGDPLFGDATLVDLSAPATPAFIRDRIRSDFGQSAQALIVNRRFVELGPRRSEVDRTFLDTVLGAEYEWDNAGHLSAHYRYGSSAAQQTVYDHVDRERLNVAVSPQACQATPGCEPIDILSRQALSADAADFIRSTPFSRNLRLAEHEVSLHWNNSPLTAPTGDLDLSAGIEATRTLLSDETENIVRGGIVGQPLFNNFDAKVDAIDVVAGLGGNLDALGALPGRTLFTVDARATFSPQHDTAHNIELGLMWRPWRNLEFFSRLHLGERPPTISELFYVDASEYFFTADPCAAGDAKSSAIVAENCLSSPPLGAGGAALSPGLALRTDYGNPNLSNEEARTLVYGFSYGEDIDRPWGNVELSLDFAWLDYTLEQEISIDTDYLNACYASAGFSNRNCGENPLTGAPLIARDPITGQLVRTDIMLFNGGSFGWRGADAELNLLFEPASQRLIDQFIASIAHTYTDRVVSAQINRPVSYLQGLPAYPRQRTLLTLGVKRGEWEVISVVNRRGAVEVDRSRRPETQVGAFTYADITVGRTIGDHADLRFSVENLTDLEPPIVAGNQVSNTFPEFYDLIGRRFSLSIRLAF